VAIFLATVSLTNDKGYHSNRYHLKSSIVAVNDKSGSLIVTNNINSTSMTATTKNYKGVQGTRKVTAKPTKAAKSKTTVRTVKINPYLFALCTAVAKFFEEEKKGYCFTEKRLQGKIEAAQLLFSEDRKAIQKGGAYVS